MYETVNFIDINTKQKPKLPEWGILDSLSFYYNNTTKVVSGNI